MRYSEKEFADALSKKADEFFPKYSKYSYYSDVDLKLKKDFIKLSYAAFRNAIIIQKPLVEVFEDMRALAIFRAIHNKAIDTKFGCDAESLENYISKDIRLSSFKANMPYSMLLSLALLRKILNTSSNEFINEITNNMDENDINILREKIGNAFDKILESARETNWENGKAHWFEEITQAKRMVLTKYCLIKTLRHEIKEITLQKNTFAYIFMDSKKTTDKLNTLSSAVNIIDQAKTVDEVKELAYKLLNNEEITQKRSIFSCFSFFKSITEKGLQDCVQHLFPVSKRS